MAKRRKEFPDHIRTKLLLWCDRHCCLCKKQCGALIELHHIDGKADDNSEDNAIPVCFDCHAKLGHYNDSQPRGLKIKADELKRRRDQVYDEFTQHLVPNVDYRVTPMATVPPRAGFFIAHIGGGPAAKAKVVLTPYVDGHPATIEDADPLYVGGCLWNLNPGMAFQGHFRVPVPHGSASELCVVAELSIVDCYDREHKLLPITYVRTQDASSWWADPVGRDVVMERATHRTGQRHAGALEEFLAPKAPQNPSERPTPTGSAPFSAQKR